jgi:hypothetical protein
MMPHKAGAPVIRRRDAQAPFLRAISHYKNMKGKDIHQHAPMIGMVVAKPMRAFDNRSVAGGPDRGNKAEAQRSRSH